MPLSEKVVLVTGANGGLGVYVTRAFLEAGCKVAGVARAIADDEFPQPNFKAFPGELDSPEAARAMVDAVLARWGGVHALVHLIGAFETGDADEEVFRRMLDANLLAFARIARAVLPGMRARGSGTVLAIGSRVAVDPQPGLGAYSASKAALVSMVQTVARENRQFGISANVILPGTMDTPANRAAMPASDFGRWVGPAQVAAMLVHLASDDASQVSGAVIPIYGGEL